MEQTTFEGFVAQTTRELHDPRPNRRETLEHGEEGDVAEMLGQENDVQAAVDDDQVLNFYYGKIDASSAFLFYPLTLLLDMLFSGIVQCAQKHATQYGDCEALVSFWKASLAIYHETGKV